MDHVYMVEINHGLFSNVLGYFYRYSNAI